MRVEDILRRKGSEVVTIEPDATIHQAIILLNERKIGALVVVEGPTIVGIVSERDILRECGARRIWLAESREPPPLVRDVMTSDLIVGVPEDGVDYVMGIMTKNRIRHLPIVQDGALAGMVSIGDVVNAHVAEAEHENRTLREYIQSGSY